MTDLVYPPSYLSDDDSYTYEAEEEDSPRLDPQVLRSTFTKDGFEFSLKVSPKGVKAHGTFEKEMELYAGSLWAIVTSPVPYTTFLEKLNYLDSPPSRLHADFETPVPYVFGEEDLFTDLEVSVLGHPSLQDLLDATLAFASRSILDRCFVCCRRLTKPLSPFHADFDHHRSYPRHCRSQFCMFQLQLRRYASNDPSITICMPFLEKALAYATSSKDDTRCAYLLDRFQDIDPHLGLSIFLPLALRPCSVGDLPLKPGTTPAQCFALVDNLSSKALSWMPPLGKTKPMDSDDDPSKPCYFFHGTKDQNVLSILCQGLVSLSNTCLMVTAAAHGEGIYLAPTLSTARQYGKYVFICMVHGAVKKTEAIYTVADGRKTLITHLLVF